MKKFEMTKIQKRLFIILAVILAYAVYDLSTAAPAKSKSTSKKTSNSQNEENNGKTVQAASAVMVAGVMPAVKKTEMIPDSWCRDPFQGYVSLSSSVDMKNVLQKMIDPKIDNFQLTAVSVNGDKSFAIINDKILGVGDEISGFRVIEIQKSSVMLRKNNFTFTIKIEEERYDF